MSKKIDITNQKFGKLTALYPSKVRGPQGQVKWECVCECGNRAVVFSQNLRRGFSQSCGRCPNDYFIDDAGDVNLIIRTKGKKVYCRISPEDFETVKPYRWSMNGSGYIFNNQVGLLSRFIMKPEEGKLVDHQSMDRTDNRRCNLRTCTKSENCMNRGPSRNNLSTGIKNLYLRKRDEYAIIITKNGKRFYKGGFYDLDEAMKIRDEMLEKLHGEFANL